MDPDTAPGAPQGAEEAAEFSPVAEAIQTEQAERQAPEGGEGAAGEGTPAGEGGAPLDEREAWQLTTWAVNTIAAALEPLHPALQIPDEERKQVVAVGVPVVMKYNGQLPAFLERWKEELMLLGTLGVLVYKHTRAVLDYNAKKEKQQAEPPDGAAPSDFTPSPFTE